jgi:hypothetical protein
MIAGRLFAVSRNLITLGYVSYFSFAFHDEASTGLLQRTISGQYLSKILPSILMEKNSPKLKQYYRKTAGCSFVADHVTFTRIKVFNMAASW